MQALPRWYRPACVVALLWNIAGLAAVASDVSMSAAQVAAMPEPQRLMHAARPEWSVLASIVAVVGGTVGTLLLLLRRQWARPFLVASIAGLLLQDAGIFFLAPRLAPLDATAAVLQSLVLLIALALLWLARRAARSGWLR